MSSRLGKLRARARSQRGFGMIELMAAMTIVSIGVLAVYGMFQSGIVQIRRASTITTAAALADAEMERFRAVKYDVLGLVDADVLAADAAYTSDSAYRADTDPATTLQAAADASQTSITVSSATDFPPGAPFLVQIDSERLLVTAVDGTTWTVQRGADLTVADAHGSGAAVVQRQRVELPSCSSSPVPCTNAVPTKTSVGADGKSYRVDTYMTWVTTANADSSATGRLHKLLTVVIRDADTPTREWARVSSAFDASTGQ